MSPPYKSSCKVVTAAQCSLQTYWRRSLLRVGFSLTSLIVKSAWWEQDYMGKIEPQMMDSAARGDAAREQ